MWGGGGRGLGLLASFTLDKILGYVGGGAVSEEKIAAARALQEDVVQMGEVMKQLEMEANRRELETQCSWELLKHNEVKELSSEAKNTILKHEYQSLLILHGWEKEEYRAHQHTAAPTWKAVVDRLVYVSHTILRQKRDPDLTSLASRPTAVAAEVAAQAKKSGDSDRSGIAIRDPQRSAREHPLRSLLVSKRGDTTRCGPFKNDYAAYANALRVSLALLDVCFGYCDEQQPGGETFKFATRCNLLRAELCLLELHAPTTSRAILSKVLADRDPFAVLPARETDTQGELNKEKRLNAYYSSAPNEQAPPNIDQTPNGVSLLLVDGSASAMGCSAPRGVASASGGSASAFASGGSASAPASGGSASAPASSRDGGRPWGGDWEF